MKPHGLAVEHQQCFSATLPTAVTEARLDGRVQKAGHVFETIAGQALFTGECREILDEALIGIGNVHVRRYNRHADAETIDDVVEDGTQCGRLHDLAVEIEGPVPMRHQRQDDRLEIAVIERVVR